jgi:hypothetical protein
MEDEVSSALEEIFDTQEQLVLDRLNSDEGKALFGAGAVAGILSVYMLSLQTNQLVEAMGAVYDKAISDNITEGYGRQVSGEERSAALANQASVVNSFNSTTRDQVIAALGVAAALTDEDGRDVDIALKVALAYSLVKSVFNKLRSKRKPLIIDSAVLGPYNQGLQDSVKESRDGLSVYKQWVSLRDERVRTDHRKLHGDKVPVGSAFFVDGVAIRFPKDPLAPPPLTINCRCVLKFGV